MTVRASAPAVALQRQTEAIHLRLITLVNEPKSELGRDTLRNAHLPDAAPNDREFYLVFLAMAWAKVCVVPRHEIWQWG